ncbi:intraflagellar transport protein 46-like, partial [Tropilaelaps mercedesae]
MQKAPTLDHNENEDAEQVDKDKIADKDGEKESGDKELVLPDGYNPQDYENLAVSAELKALFKL